MPRIVSSDPNAGDSQQRRGRIVSSDPDAVDSKQGGNPDESHNHPYLAALTRLLGGVGSAIASPADVTVLGSAIPAAISGGSESLAEYLEGSPQSAARIGTEAAIGAVPFAKLVKSGRMVANMGKAAVLGGVGEGAREKAKGEDLSLGQIGGSAALNAATYGLFHKFLGGGIGPAGPSGPKMDVPPVIEQQPGNKVFRLPPDWESKVPNNKPTPPPQPPSVMGQHNFANEVRTGVGKAIGKAPNAASALNDLDSGIQDATKIASQHRTSNFRTEVQTGNRENAADLADIKRLLAIKEDGGALPTDVSDIGIPNGAGKKPPLEDSLYTNPQPHAPWGGAVIPNLDQYLTSTAQKAIDEGNAANVGGLPVLGTPSVHVPSVEPSPVDALKKVLSPRPSRSVKTVEGFNRALGKRIEAGGLPGDTPVVPQDAPGAVIGDTNIPAPSPDVNVAPEPTSDQIEAMAENRGLPPQGRPPSATHPYEINEVGGKLGVFDTSKAGSKPLLITDNPDEAESLIRTLTQAKNVTPSAPESPLLKILKTRQGATGANYRAAKDAAKRGEIPSADYARDGHLVELGKTPEGPFAGPPTPRTPGQTIDQLLDAQGTPRTAPVEGGMVEPQPTGNPDAGAAGAPEAPDWVRKANEELEAMKKDPGQRGAMAPGLLKLLSTGTGAAIGAPVGSYLDPEDPNAGIKGAVVGGTLGYGLSPSRLINLRNAGLLATPGAQGKKPLSDIGAIAQQALEDVITPSRRANGLRMVSEALNMPENAREFAAGWKDPNSARTAVGESLPDNPQNNGWLLKQVTKPFAAMQRMSAGIMTRSGHTPEEAQRTLMLGSPMDERHPGDLLDKAKIYDTAQWALNGQRYPFMRALRPFARIGTNIAVRGAQRIPGISMVSGDPETRLARTILGTGALGAGALTGMSDANTEESGQEPTSPIVRGLRRALLASYGVPFVLGESLTGPRGIRDLAFMTPGAQEVVPLPGQKDTFGTYGKKLGKRWIDQMFPDWLSPEATSSESAR